MDWNDFAKGRTAVLGRTAALRRLEHSQRGPAASTSLADDHSVSLANLHVLARHNLDLAQMALELARIEAAELAHMAERESLRPPQRIAGLHELR